MIPNKKADGRFEVCGSANGRPMLAGVYLFLFRSHALIPCVPFRRRATPGLKAKERGFAVCRFGERKKMLSWRATVPSVVWTRGPDG